MTLRPALRRTVGCLALLLTAGAAVAFWFTPYRIPTPSMEPVIAPGDVVLSNAPIWWGRSPRRWEVAIFRRPSEPATCYIKRIVGLPGEALDLVDGDLHVDGRLEPKPESVQEDAWRPFYCGEAAAGDLFDHWRVEAGDWRVVEGRLTARGGPAVLALARPVVDDGRYGPGAGDGRLPVGDVRLRLLVALDGPGRLGIEIEETGERLLLDLPVGPAGTPGEIGRDAVSFAALPEVRLEPGRFHALAFDNADQTLRLVLDGRRLVERRYGALPGAGHPGARVRLTVRGGATFERLRLDRDLHWFHPPGAAEGPYQVPEGAYFLLGDNANRSRDARYWPAHERYVPRSGLLARAEWVVWPPRRAHPIR